MCSYAQTVSFQIREVWQNVTMHTIANYSQPIHTETNIEIFLFGLIHYTTHYSVQS